MASGVAQASRLRPEDAGRDAGATPAAFARCAVTPCIRYAAMAMATCLLLMDNAAALSISNAYSPRNRKREKRKRTEYIILHTTEAPGDSALKKLRRNGEAHYFVDRRGHVSRVIDRKRVAFHAGRSMWDGKANLDRFSIGIEIEGYHNRDITSAQYKAVPQLLKELQKIYRVPDERVLTHSMIAYGAPNRWHRRSHRGRKRCGMLFARRSVRLKLGLKRQPLSDPDVNARRLVVADPYLARVLYGSAKEQETAVLRYAGDSALVISATRSAWDIARDKYNSAETQYVFPDGTRKNGNQIGNWKAMPGGTRVILGANQCDNALEVFKQADSDGQNAKDIAGEEYDQASTVYFFPDGRIRCGNDLKESELASLPGKTRLLVGYTYGGYITAKRSAYDICGVRWRFPSTYYRYSDGRIVKGDTISEKAMPKNTLVFFQN